MLASAHRGRLVVLLVVVLAAWGAAAKKTHHPPPPPPHEAAVAMMNTTNSSAPGLSPWLNTNSSGGESLAIILCHHLLGRELH
jgi:hypothetical protein